MGAGDFPEELAGFLGFLLDEGEEPTCALCGKPIRQGESRRIRSDRQLEHVRCPADFP